MTSLLLLAFVALTVAYFGLWVKHRLLVRELSRVKELSSSDRLALEQTERRSEHKDEAVSIVSHEIRIPLTSIRASLGLIASGAVGQVDDRAAHLLRVASKNTERLLRLTDDILDLSRIDSGLDPVRMVPCRIKELVIQAADTLQPMAQAAGVTVILGEDSLASDVEVAGDADRLLQVFCNLLSNAIKFSSSNSTVLLDLSVSPDGVVLQVRDSGRGIPAEQLGAIFERFKQVEPRDASQKGGTGLGLAITRSIVQQHGGNVYAQRNDSTTPAQPGTTFVVTLPMCRQLLSRAG